MKTADLIRYIEEYYKLVYADVMKTFPRLDKETAYMLTYYIILSKNKVN